MTRATNDLEDDRNGYDIFCSKGTHFSPEGPVREVLTLLRQEKPVLSFEAASTDTGMSFRSCPFGPQLSLPKNSSSSFRLQNLQKYALLANQSLQKVALLAFAL